MFNRASRHFAIACLAALGAVASVLACPPLNEENEVQAPPAEMVAEAMVAVEAKPELAPKLAQIDDLDRDDMEWFREAAKAMNLAALLPSDGDYTIFVPTNDAYQAMTDATRIALRSDQNLDNLRTILAHHIVKGRLSAEDLIGKTELQTLSGQTVGIDASFGGITIGRAQVIESDIEIDGAVVHLIDKVLIPREMMLIPDGPLLMGMYVRHPDPNLASSLGVKRAHTLLVTSLVDGANAGPAGVRKGDIVLSIDGEHASVEAGERAKKNKGVGKHIELVILRNGEKITILVPVGIDPR